MRYSLRHAAALLFLAQAMAPEVQTVTEGVVRFGIGDVHLPPPVDHEKPRNQSRHFRPMPRWRGEQRGW